MRKKKFKYSLFSTLPKTRPALEMTFVDINSLPFNINDVDEWNAQYLYTGINFQDLLIIGNTVYLFDPISYFPSIVPPILSGEIGDNSYFEFTAPDVISVVDNVNCITRVGLAGFKNLNSLSLVRVPVCLTADNYAFDNTPSMQTAYFPLCKNLRGSFPPIPTVFGMVGTPTVLTVPRFLETSNGGAEDVSIQEFRTFNPAGTVVFV